MRERFGPYALLRPLPEGAFGEVWLAEVADAVPSAPKLRVGSRVALKRLRHVGEDLDPEVADRFRQERHLLATLDDPNVVAVHDAGDVDTPAGPRSYIAMEYVHGRNLKDYLRDEGPLDSALVLAIAADVAHGLMALQARNIIHRDIKPANLVIADDGGMVKIVDLGSARAGSGTLTYTREGRVVGTPLYLAPEQYQDPDKVGKQTDLYALGLVLFELLTGEHPFPLHSGEYLPRANHQPVPSLGARGILVPPFLEGLVRCLLEERPEDRLPDAAALYQALDAGEASTWWRARPRRTAIGLPRPLRRLEMRTRLVGRRKELDTLTESWEAARRGKGATCVLVGEHGSGRTRLVGEFARLVAADVPEAAILYGAAYPGGLGIAMGAARTALASYLGEGELERALGRHLGEGAPLTRAFAAFLRGDVPQEAGIALDSELIGTCFVRVLRDVARVRPTLFILDDLDQAVSEGQALFLRLGHELADEHFLLLGTTTEATPTSWWQAMRGLPRVREIVMERLGVDAVRRMLVPKIGRPTANRIAPILHERSDGSPLYVAEYLAGLEDGADPTTARPPPRRIRDVFAARLAALTDEERELLEVAAVAGYRFDPRLVATVLGRPQVPVLQAILRLQRAHGLVQSLGQHCVFKHHATHEIVLSELPPPLAREIHALIARALEDRLARAPERREPEGPLHVQTLEHWIQAERSEEARVHFEPALAYVRSQQRHSEALDLLRRMLDLPGGLDGAARLEAAIELARTCDHCGRFAEEDKVVEEAEGLVTEETPAATVSRLAAAHSRVAQARGRLEEGLAEALRSADFAERAEDAALHVEAVALHGMALLRANRQEEARDIFTGLLACTREDEPSQARAHAQTGLARIAHYRDDLETSRHYYEACLDTVKKMMGSYRALAIAHLNLGGVLIASRRWEEAAPHLEDARDLGRRIGLRACEAKAIGNLAHAREGQGRLAEALDLFAQGLAMHEDVGDQQAVVIARHNVASCLEDCGLLDEAESMVSQCIEEAQALKAKDLEADALALLSDIAYVRGEDAIAREQSLAAQRLYVQARRSHAAQQEDWRRAFWAWARGHDVEQARRMLEAGLATLDPADPRLVRPRWMALASALDLLPAAQAIDAFHRVEKQVPVGSQPMILYLLWRASGSLYLLDRAREVVQALRRHAPPEARETIVTNVPVHRFVLEAWNERSAIHIRATLEEDA